MPPVPALPRSAAQVDQGLRAFMLGVYNNMVLGLAISAVVALGRQHAGNHQRSVAAAARSAASVSRRSAGRSMPRL